MPYRSFMSCPTCQHIQSVLRDGTEHRHAECSRCRAKVQIIAAPHREYNNTLNATHPGDRLLRDDEVEQIANEERRRKFQVINGKRFPRLLHEAKKLQSYSGRVYELIKQQRDTGEDLRPDLTQLLLTIQEQASKIDYVLFCLDPSAEAQKSESDEVITSPGFDTLSS